MKLSELMQQLYNIAHELNESEFEAGEIFPEPLGVDPEVLLAQQPRYPLQFHVACVTRVEDEETGSSTVYIAEGSSCYNKPYAPHQAWWGEE